VPEKTLREGGASSAYALGLPILYRDLEGMEYNIINPKLIYMMKYIAYAETK
jgi:hypothetical protein